MAPLALKGLTLLFILPTGIYLTQTGEYCGYQPKGYSDEQIHLGIWNFFKCEMVEVWFIEEAAQHIWKAMIRRKN